jgi:hypothetical protein
MARTTAKPRLSTTQRGLGGDHQAARKAALAALRDGDPCARCELAGIYHPMTRSLITWVNGVPSSRFLDLDDFPGRAFGGPQVKRLSWRKCNRSAGARLGNSMRRARRPRKTVYNRW